MARKKKEAAQPLPVAKNKGTRILKDTKKDEFKRFLYSACLTPEEKDIFEEIGHDDLRDEERLLRLMILRLLKEDALCASTFARHIEKSGGDRELLGQLLAADPTFDVDQFTETDNFKDGYSRTIVRRRKNIHYMISNYITKLVLVRRTRAELTGGLQSNVEDQAKQILDAIKAIEEVQSCKETT